MDISNKQVRLNFYTNILSLLINVGVGILYTPYLVKSLGIIAYGVIPLTLIINQYIGVITDAITSSLTRFFTIETRNENHKKAEQYITTGFYLILLFIGILLVPLYFFINDIDYIFNIPSTLLDVTKILFFCTISSFFFSLITSIINIPLYAQNRLDLLNVIKILRGALKPFIVLIAFQFYDISIHYIGISNLLVEVIILSMSYLFFKRNSQINLALRNYSPILLKSMGVMTLWVILQSLGDIGIYRIDNILLNVFWSTKESGIIGAIAEFGNNILVITALFTSLFGPLILIHYSSNNHEKLVELVTNRTLTIGIISAVLVGVLIGYSSIIIKYWLGANFINYSSWLIIKILYIPFYASSGLFVIAYRSWNKVAYPAISTVTIGLLNFLISFILAKYTPDFKFKIELILIIGLLFSIIQSYILNAYFFSAIYKKTNKLLIINFLKIAFTLVLCSLISYISSFVNESGSIWISIPLIAFSLIIFTVLAIFITHSKTQRNELLQFIYKKE